MRTPIELPASLRGLPAPWSRLHPLSTARETLEPTAANIRVALDVAARSLEETLRVPPPGDYSSFPGIYSDEEYCPWGPIDLALETLDEFDVNLVERVYVNEGLSQDQRTTIAQSWVRSHVFEVARAAVIWLGEARRNQPDAPELPTIFQLCDRHLEQVTPVLGVRLLSTIWDIAREGAHPRLLAAAANPNLSDRVRQKAEFLYGLSLEDPNELKEFILSGEPALPQDREPRE